MKRKILLIVMLAALGAVCIAQVDRTAVIMNGQTMLSRPMSFTDNDTITTSDTTNITIHNPQAYMQHQVFTYTLDSVSGDPSITVIAYGKVSSDGSWTQIGSTQTWDDVSDNPQTISSTAPINYNYLKVEFAADGTTQKSKILTFDVRTANAMEVPSNAGTVTFSRATSGTVTLTSADDDANAALTVAAGGTGALTLGDATSTTAITSSDWAIGATGAMTGIGAITADGAISGTSITGTAKISTTATTEQLRLNYDADNYATATVASDGALTIVTVDDAAAEGDINLNPDGLVGVKTAVPTVELDVTGDIKASGTISAATYGSDGSISNAELLTLDNGALTEILVGGGAGSTPVWTTATGTGAPVRAGSPTFTTSVFSPIYDVTGAAGITFGSADATKFTFSGISEDLVLTPSENTWTLSTGSGVTSIAVGSLNLTGVGTIGSGKLSSTGGVDLGTSQALTGTTALTIGAGTETVAVNSSDWDISATGDVSGIGKVVTDSTLSVGSWGYTGEHVTLPEASSNTNAGLGNYSMVDYSATAGKVFAGTYSRMLAMTTNQTNQSSMYGTESQFRLRDVNLADGDHAGIWAYAEQSGTSVLSGNGTFSAISATVESASTFTVGATEHVTGITVDASIDAGASIDGSANYSAVYIKSNGLDWFYGINIEGVDDDICLQNDETITNSTDGTVAISGVLSANLRAATVVVNTDESETLTAAQSGAFVTFDGAGTATIPDPSSATIGVVYYLLQTTDADLTVTCTTADNNALICNNVGTSDSVTISEAGHKLGAGMIVVGVSATKWYVGGLNPESILTPEAAD